MKKILSDISSCELSELKIAHAKYLGLEYVVRCYNIFSEEELDILKEYGCWMEALLSHHIKPFTEGQKHFIAAVNGLVAAENIFEKVWIKYQRRLQWEHKNGNLLLFKKDVDTSYHQTSRQRGW